MLAKKEFMIIDGWFKASKRGNRIHAYEIKRGEVDRKGELNRLISKVARFYFKSVNLYNPKITGEVLTLEDVERKASDICLFGFFPNRMKSTRRREKFLKLLIKRDFIHYS